MAIEAKDLTQKDELISKLCTLKAGLSLIEEANKEIRQIEALIETANMGIRHRKSSIDFDSKMLRKIHQDIKEEELNIENLRKEKERFIIEKASIIKENVEEKYIAERTGLRFILIALPIICFFGTLFFLALLMGVLNLIVGDATVNSFWFFKWLFSGTEPEMCGKLALVSAGVYLICCILVIYNNKRKRKEIIEWVEADYNKKLNKYDEDTKERMSSVSDWEMNIKILEEDHAQCQQSLMNCKRELAMYTREKTDLVIPNAVRTAKIIKYALDKQFKNILSEEDWVNIDLIIYYLQTGRADSLKEALVLVDRQLQTDQITNAIFISAEYMAKQFKMSFAHLDGEIKKCCSDLSDQINKNHNELVATTSDAMEVTSTSADQIRKAVIDSANRQSDELIRELRYNQQFWSKS